MIIDIPPMYEQHIQQLADERGLTVSEYIISLLPIHQSDVQIDIPRMQQALQSERVVMPQGLSCEEKRQFISAFAQVKNI